MKISNSPSILPLMQRFFVQRLMQQLDASPHTIDSYRSSFKLLFRFASKRLGLPPERMHFEQIDAPLITEFLDDLETSRNVCARTRNLRLTAIHSFFRYTAFELPTHGAQIQRVLAIPGKRFTRKQVGFLNRDEVDALLDAPDQGSWSGRRDHAFILTAVQTGLRVSEMTGIKSQDVVLGTSAHVQVIGKGRKSRSTPLAKPTCAVLKAWLRESQRGEQDVLFPNFRGERMTIHGVQHLLKKHQAVAVRKCPSLENRRVTVHVLRHTAAMDMLQAGIDRSVIAMWLGHESFETTQVYVEATLEMKEQALARTTPHKGKPKRYKAEDSLLAFLDNL